LLVAPLLLTACLHAPSWLDADGGALSGGTYLRGFDLSWQKNPHRLRRLGVLAAGRAMAGGELDARFQAELRGGNWASGTMGEDVAEMTVYYGSVLAPGLVYEPGAATLRVTGSHGRGRRPDTPAATSATVTIPLPRPVEPGEAAAWLTGFHIDTEATHADGYTPRRVSVALGEPVIEGAVARVPVRVEVQAGPVWDRNQHLESYGATVRVELALVAAPGGRAQRLEVQGRADAPLSQVLDRAEPLRVPLQAALAPDAAAAAAGLSGFEVELLHEEGRYLRALSVGLEGRHRPERDSYEGEVFLRFANSSQLARKVRARMRGSFTVLESPAPAQVVESRWSPEPGQAREALLRDVQGWIDRARERLAALVG